MSDDYSVIITDTSPLITLAKADELDVLLRLGVTVRIPDIVYLEATHDLRHDDAIRIVEWARDNDDLVRVVPTSQVRAWQILKEQGEKAPDYGERAAIEVVNAYTDQRPGAGVLLVYEDNDMNQFAIRAEVDMTTTGKLLRALEADRAIQSADRILDQAAEAGRNVDQQRKQTPSEELTEKIRLTRERNRDRNPGRGRGGFER